MDALRTSCVWGHQGTFNGITDVSMFYCLFSRHCQGRISVYFLKFPIWNELPLMSQCFSKRQNQYQQDVEQLVGQERVTVKPSCSEYLKSQTSTQWRAGLLSNPRYIYTKHCEIRNSLINFISHGPDQIRLISAFIRLRTTQLCNKLSGQLSTPLFQCHIVFVMQLFLI